MSTLPKPPSNHAQERRGINAVAVAAIKLGGHIWRETPVADVGIDGQIEYVDENSYATGQTVAVQVKCGPSYLINEDQDSYKYYPEKKHLTYWERFPLPVILILHDPDKNQSYWVDARQALRSPSSAGLPYIRVPKRAVLETTAATELFQNAGVQSERFIPNIVHVFEAMVGRQSPDGRISFLDLFTHGLTNIARSLYFGIDLALNAAEARLAMEKSRIGVGFGGAEYDFLFDYLTFLVAQKLADMSFSDCLIDWKDRKLVPQFVAPLSQRGRLLVLTIDALENHLVEAKVLDDGNGLRVAQEGWIEMQRISYSQRIPRIVRFQEAVRKMIADRTAESTTPSSTLDK